VSKEITKTAARASLEDVAAVAQAVDDQIRVSLAPVFARTACLHQLVVDLADGGVGRRVLDSQPSRDQLDARTIWATLGTRPGTVLRFDHADSASEPSIWVADPIGWAHGADGEWRRVAPAVTCVNDRTS
jgi:hypothetical protein